MVRIINRALFPTAMITKSRLAITLSRLEGFGAPDLRLEQYPTDSEVAAAVLSFARDLGDIEGKAVADLGSGTGVLGIGALLLGAKFVHFVDRDAKACRICEDNLKSLGLKSYSVENQQVTEFDAEVDTVVQNPPFGAQRRHADREFLEKAMQKGRVVYTIHNANSEGFVSSLAKDFGFEVTHTWNFEMPLKKSFDHQTRRLHRIRVACWRLNRK